MRFITYHIAPHCSIVQCDERPPHITTQSDTLYRRLTPYRALEDAKRYLRDNKARYGAAWGYAEPKFAR